ncbi:plastocyanin [Roseovarius sp. MBR-78]|uniref:hypothetical protein n=1 Tax=Roseovarius sp. MBR-78 TaxID=3156460 RepID=UPI003397161E
MKLRAGTSGNGAGALSRRSVIAAGMVISGLALARPFDAHAAVQTVSVKQLTDPKATAATGMFRFVPDLVMLDVGGGIVFFNSLAQHTVHSVPQIWPEGVAPVSIFNTPRVEVGLPVTGFYGFRCNRHGGYGMVMLAAVGAPPVPADIGKRVSNLRAERRERDAVLHLFERYATDRENTRSTSDERPYQSK